MTMTRAPKGAACEPPDCEMVAVDGVDEGLPVVTLATVVVLEDP
jgi:hypothetical protein